MCVCVSALVFQVQEAVHGVTIEECQTALQNHGWNVQKAVHSLKVRHAAEVDRTTELTYRLPHSVEIVHGWKHPLNKHISVSICIGALVVCVAPRTHALAHQGMIDLVLQFSALQPHTAACAASWLSYPPFVSTGLREVLRGNHSSHSCISERERADECVQRAVWEWQAGALNTSASNTNDITFRGKTLLNLNRKCKRMLWSLHHTIDQSFRGGCNYFCCLIWNVRGH